METSRLEYPPSSHFQSRFRSTEVFGYARYYIILTSALNIARASWVNGKRDAALLVKQTRQRPCLVSQSTE